MAEGIQGAFPIRDLPEYSERVHEAQVSAEHLHRELRVLLKVGWNLPEVTQREQEALKAALAALAPIAQVLAVIATHVRLEVDHG